MCRIYIYIYIYTYILLIIKHSGDASPENDTSSLLLYRDIPQVSAEQLPLTEYVRRQYSDRQPRGLTGIHTCIYVYVYVLCFVVCADRYSECILILDSTLKRISTQNSYVTSHWTRSYNTHECNYSLS